MNLSLPDLSKLKVINGSVLKLIAFVSMVIDHVGVSFFPGEEGFRIIGRLAFPLFCFLIVQGYLHSHNIIRYAIRLLVFAIISEVFFDWALFGQPFYLPRQNVFFTLLIGLVTIFAVDSVLKIERYVLAFVFALIGMGLAQLIRCDYGFKGILIILVFYLMSMCKSFLKTGNWAILFLVLTFILINFNGTQTFAVLALIPIYFYNGKRGLSGKALKYLFYAGYPLHLCIILIIKIYLGS